MYIERFEERRTHPPADAGVTERRVNPALTPTRMFWDVTPERLQGTVTAGDDYSDGLDALGTRILAHYAHELLDLLRFTTVLPNSIVERWSRKIRTINLEEPAHSLLILDEIYLDYWSVFGAYKPGHDLVELGEVRPLQFDEEMQAIKNRLDWLEAVLNRTEAGRCTNTVFDPGELTDATEGVEGPDGGIQRVASTLSAINPGPA